MGYCMSDVRPALAALLLPDRVRGGLDLAMRPLGAHTRVHDQSNAMALILYRGTKC